MNTSKRQKDLTFSALLDAAERGDARQWSILANAMPRTNTWGRVPDGWIHPLAHSLSLPLGLAQRADIQTLALKKMDGLTLDQQRGIWTQALNAAWKATTRELRAQEKAALAAVATEIAPEGATPSTVNTDTPLGIASSGTGPAQERFFELWTLCSERETAQAKGAGTRQTGQRLRPEHLHLSVDGPCEAVWERAMVLHPGFCRMLSHACYRELNKLDNEPYKNMCERFDAPAASRPQTPKPKPDEQRNAQQEQAHVEKVVRLANRSIDMCLSWPARVGQGQRTEQERLELLNTWLMGIVSDWQLAGIDNALENARKHRPTGLMTMLDLLMVRGARWDAPAPQETVRQRTHRHQREDDVAQERTHALSAPSANASQDRAEASSKINPVKKSAAIESRAQFGCAWDKSVAGLMSGSWRAKPVKAWALHAACQQLGEAEFLRFCTPFINARIRGESRRESNRSYFGLNGAGDAFDDVSELLRHSKEECLFWQIAMHGSDPRTQLPAQIGEQALVRTLRMALWDKTDPSSAAGVLEIWGDTVEWEHMSMPALTMRRSLGGEWDAHQSWAAIARDVQDWPDAARTLALWPAMSQKGAPWPFKDPRTAPPGLFDKKGLEILKALMEKEVLRLEMQPSQSSLSPQSDAAASATPTQTPSASDDAQQKSKVRSLRL